MAEEIGNLDSTSAEKRERCPLDCMPKKLALAAVEGQGKLRAEIRELRRELGIAVGILSTHGQFVDQQAEDVLEYMRQVAAEPAQEAGEDGNGK